MANIVSCHYYILAYLIAKFTRNQPTAFPKQMVEVDFKTVVRLVFQNACIALWNLIAVWYAQEYQLMSM